MSVGTLSLEPHAVVRLLVGLRAVAALLLAISVAFMTRAGDMSNVFWCLPAALVAFDGVVIWQTGSDRPISSQQIGLHLTIDSLVLFLLFWWTGGATNPFVSLFLVPVALASVALKVRDALVVTTLCLLAYTALLLRYLHRVGDPAQLIGFERHVIGMWLNFVLATILLCICLLALVSLLRRRERELAAERERLLRDEAIVSVATVAAGAAHALNTPLATIAVAAESISDHPQLPADVHEDIATIRSQVDICAGQLRELVAAHDHQRHASCMLNDYAREIMQRWRTRRPEIEAEIRGLQAMPAFRLRDDPALSQALLNLLDNAADASLAAGHSQVLVDWRCEPDPPAVLALSIDDAGRLDNPETLNRNLAATTKPHGLGLGLTLARASIARLGGHLLLTQGPHSGTRTIVRLPLAALAEPLTGN